MDVNERRDILVTCGPGLKDYLVQELKSLGFSIGTTHSGGVVTSGSFLDCMKLNFCLRTAYSVLYLVKKFRCGSGESLYKTVTKLPWEKIISPDEYICIISNVDTYSVDNSMYPSLKVKDAIVDRLQKKTGTRPDSGPDRNNVVLNLFWKHDNAWLYLNTSGVKLSDRNYRKLPHRAPIRESLAAGLLMGTGYDGTSDIVLPMAGSGTFAIEAAMIATSRAAGSLRINFGMQHLLPFNKELWQQMRTDLRKVAKRTKLTHKIIATDIDPVAIEASRQNARTAGVEDLIDFKVCDFAETSVPVGSGIVLMNPEYGLRLGDIETLKLEYKRMGDFFKKCCTGYRCYVFTGNKDLSDKIKLRTSSRDIFYNGSIECRLLEYKMYLGSKS